jgi:hypothetical protein
VLHFKRTLHSTPLGLKSPLLVCNQFSDSIKRYPEQVCDTRYSTTRNTVHNAALSSSLQKSVIKNFREVIIAAHVKLWSIPAECVKHTGEKFNCRTAENFVSLTQSSEYLHLFIAYLTTLSFAQIIHSAPFKTQI